MEVSAGRSFCQLENSVQTLRSSVRRCISRLAAWLVRRNCRGIFFRQKIFRKFRVVASASRRFVFAFSWKKGNRDFTLMVRAEKYKSPGGVADVVFTRRVQIARRYKR